MKTITIDGKDIRISDESYLEFKKQFIIPTYADVVHSLLNGSHTLTVGFSKEHALIMLINVAKYLNGDWEIDWSETNKQYKWTFYVIRDSLRITCSTDSNYGNVYFKTQELCKQAIEILGESKIKKALTLNL